MDPSLSPDIEAIRDMVNRFMQTEVAPVMDDFERRGVFPRDLVRKAGEAGLYGAVFPESVGGTDMGYLAATVIQEEMVRNDVRFASCNNQQGSTCPSCIYFGGSAEQIKKYVPNLLAGKTIGMMSLTESGGGSDAEGNMKTFARRDGDVYRISGQKMWASMANECDVGVLFAKTDRNAGAKGVTGFIVQPKKYPGWKATPIDTMGLSKSFRTNVVYLDDFVVPVEDRLGEEGDGFKIAMKGLDGGRINIAACSLGAARACLEAARAHLGVRTAFGKKLAEFQALQFKLADMATELEAARLMIRHAASMLDARHPKATMYCAMAKRYATDAGFAIANDALQIHGGYGYLKDYGLEKLVRDLRVHQILEGTNEIMRVVISRKVLGGNRG